MGYSDITKEEAFSNKINQGMVDLGHPTVELPYMGTTTSNKKLDIS